MTPFQRLFLFLIAMAVLVFLIVFLGAASLFKQLVTAPSPMSVPTPTFTPTPTFSPTPTPSPTPIPGRPTPVPPLISQVNIYLIALNDNGRSGPAVGCGDSVVPIVRTIAPTSAPLRGAYQELLAQKSQFFGQSGLYNALFQSNLSVQTVSIDTNGHATVNLRGTLVLGGVCDAPRVKAQLESTATQFSAVRSVQIFINNQDLDQLLSQQG